MIFRSRMSSFTKIGAGSVVYTESAMMAPEVEDGGGGGLFSGLRAIGVLRHSNRLALHPG